MTIPTPPTAHPVDKGYAWAIVVGAFGIHFFCFGYIRSFGILFLEFQKKYEASSAATAVISGVQFCMYSLTTLLVVNVILKRFSIRQSCLVGSVLQSLGIALNGLVSDINFLIVTQGVVFGAGFAMLYCPSLIIVSQYFNTRRALATVLATCGVSAGGVTLPLLIRYLVDNYGLQGGLLVLAAIMLNQALFASLFTPTGKYTFVQAGTATLNNENHQEIELRENMQHSSETHEQESLLEQHGDNATQASLHPRHHNQQLVKENNITGHRSEGQYSDQSKLSSSFEVLPLNLEIDDHSPNNIRDTPVEGRPAAKRDLETRSSLKSTVLNVLSTSAVDIHGSLHSLTQLDKCPPELIQLASDVRNGELDKVEIQNMQKKRRCRLPSVARKATFWAVLVFFGCGGIASALPPIFMPPLAKEKGLTNISTLMLIISAVTELFGRLIPGFIINAGWLRPPSAVLFPMVACATVYEFTEYFNDTGTLLTLAVLSGLFTGTFWSTQSLVVIDVFGMEKLGPMLGFYFLVLGLSAGAAHPISGLLRDLTGTYATTFQFFGAMYYVATIMMSIINLIKRNAHKGSGSSK